MLHTGKPISGLDIDRAASLDYDFRWALTARVNCKSVQKTGHQPSAQAGRAAHTLL